MARTSNAHFLMHNYAVANITVVTETPSCVHLTSFMSINDMSIDPTDDFQNALDGCNYLNFGYGELFVSVVEN